MIVTASSPSGSTVISQRSLRSLTRAAAVTSPSVTVKAWSRIAAGAIETSFVNATLKVKAVLPSWSCGTFSKLAVRVSVLVIVPLPGEPTLMSSCTPKYCRTTWKLSLGSFTPSSTTPNEKVFCVSPGWKVTLSGSGWVMSLKSAVPDEKRTLMVTALTVGRFRLIVKSIVSSVPSTALASLIETARGTALTMVAVPVSSAKELAPFKLLSFRSNVSSLSAIVVGFCGVRLVSPTVLQRQRRAHHALHDVAAFGVRLPRDPVDAGDRVPVRYSDPHLVRSAHDASRPVDYGPSLRSCRVGLISSSCRSPKLRAQMVAPLHPPTAARSAVCIVRSSVSRMSNTASPVSSTSIIRVSITLVTVSWSGISGAGCEPFAILHSPSYRAAAAAQAAAIASGR